MSALIVRSFTLRPELVARPINHSPSSLLSPVQSAPGKTDGISNFMSRAAEASAAAEAVLAFASALSLSSREASATVVSVRLVVPMVVLVEMVVPSTLVVLSTVVVLSDPLSLLFKTAGRWLASL